MEEYEVINITVSDGTEKEFAIMDTFEMNDKKYVAVSLVEGDEIVEGEYIYSYTESEDGEMIVQIITDEAEYDAVVEAYSNED